MARCAGDFYNCVNLWVYPLLILGPLVVRPTIIPAGWMGSSQILGLPINIYR